MPPRARCRHGRLDPKRVHHQGSLGFESALLGSLIALAAIFLPRTINWVMETRRERRERRAAMAEGSRSRTGQEAAGAPYRV
jgi:hypothetical protein